MRSCLVANGIYLPLSSSHATMQEPCDLKVRVDGQHTFFVNQRVVSTFSGRMRTLIKQEKKTTQNGDLGIRINGFPCGSIGFELVMRFCYSNGKTELSPTNVSLLHCAAAFLEMTEEMSSCNLLHQSETFLEGLFYWTWNDILTALKACESFLVHAESSGLLQKLIFALLDKIRANSDVPLTPSSSSSSSSPETNSAFRFSSSTKTPDRAKSSPIKAWWFEDLTIFSPKIIERVLKTMGACGTQNNRLDVTRFLLLYLKTTGQKQITAISRNEYGSLADTAVHGVVSIGEAAFTCRALFQVLRVVSGFGLSKDCRMQLERLMALVLDQATLDDLLVSGHDGYVYDVNLVLRLLRLFVNELDSMSFQRLKKVGRLMDKYMGEISPDPSIKVSKFLAVAESLPDSARDSYDRVYRAIDIYLESHPCLSFDERSRLCRCLNYEKLTLESCKELAKNPRIPPRIAIQALASQQSKVQAATEEREMPPLDEKENMRKNLERMQSRVMELEELCKQMKGQMSKMVKNKVISSPVNHRSLPRLC
ncbi:BTB/POZ domain-containing protein At3g19850-like [Aristolochia californica]|uniref:BTB/POZ domain-containing protein At3g19850-like n=1 Tax=Aristolochia californica TaxID=171875 RepID=UPI0035DCA735